MKDKDEFLPALGPVWHDGNTACMFEITIYCHIRICNVSDLFSFIIMRI